MTEFLNKETTINFNGDLKMDSRFREYNNHSFFKIIGLGKDGLYLLIDPNGNQIKVKKRNINYFNR